jgi:ABC-type antimicrobial peptide transport system permease subunit
MGILGLFSFMVVQRTKEISIRKVVGANISNIFVLFSKDFIWLLVLSFMIALPTCYYIITIWLDSFALKMNLSVWLFLLPLLIIFITSAFTTSTQIIKVLKTKAIDTLRYE